MGQSRKFAGSYRGQQAWEPDRGMGLGLRIGKPVAEFGEGQGVALIFLCGQTDTMRFLDRLLLAVGILMLFDACSPACPTMLARTEVRYGFDFRPYNEQGFVFSPYAPDGAYTIQGMIRNCLSPAVIPVKGDVVQLQGYDKVGGFYVQETNLLIPDVIDSMYRFCLDIDANALYEFDVDIETEEYLMATGSAGICLPVYIDKVCVEGVAVKR
jgi:hypothetical protein